MFYEIIYEPGTKSVAEYADDTEAQTALQAHHDRAKNGEPGTPQSAIRQDIAGTTNVGTWAAERIKKVLVYDEHPGSYQQDYVVSEEDLKGAFDEALKGSAMQGLVHVPTIVEKLFQAASPIAYDAGRHDSQYKMEEARELDLAFLED